MRKRIVSLLLALCMTVALSPATALATAESMSNVSSTTADASVAGAPADSAASTPAASVADAAASDAANNDANAPAASTPTDGATAGEPASDANGGASGTAPDNQPAAPDSQPAAPNNTQPTAPAVCPQHTAHDDACGYVAAADTAKVKATIANDATESTQAGTTVAKIDEAPYATVQAAVDAVKEGQTITLVADTLEAVTIPSTNAFSFTLDLSGKKLYHDAPSNQSQHPIKHSGGGRLTIKDSAGNGEIYAENNTVIVNESAGGLEIQSGTIRAKGETCSAIHTSTGAILISGGTLQSKQTTITHYSAGTVTISGGKVISTEGSAISTSGTAHGAVSISDNAELTGAISTILIGATPLTMTGGKVTCTQTGKAISVGTLSFSGGEIISEDDGVYVRGNSSISNDATVKSNGYGVLFGTDGIALTIKDTSSITSVNKIGIRNIRAIVSIPSGSPVISGGKQAMIDAPDTSSYKDVKVTASTNADGSSPEAAYDATSIATYKYLTFETSTFKAVTDITGVPTTATAGTDLALIGTVAPADATNQTITWSVTDAGTTGATITGSTLKTTAAGTLIVKATITNGATESTNFTKVFSIDVTASGISVSGTVTNENGQPVANAIVRLEENNNVKYSVFTDKNGNYTIQNVANGNYSIVAVIEDKNGNPLHVMTDSVTVAGASVKKDMQFIDGTKNTVVQVEPGAPHTTVSGLNELLNKDNIVKTLSAAEQSAVANGGSVELKLVSTGKTASEVAQDKSKIEAIAGGKKIDLLVDLSVIKTVNDATGTNVSKDAKIETLEAIIAVNLAIPESLQSKTDLTVYRVHKEKAEALSKDKANANGEYFTLSADKTYVTLYVKNFSTYAIASTSGGSASTSTSTASGTATLPQYTITATAGPGGYLSTGKTVVVFEGESAGFTITPNKGYRIADVIVNGKSIGAQNYYAFKNIRANQTIHAVFTQGGHINPQTNVAD